MCDGLRDHRVGVLPGHRMLWVEGHPAVDGLAHPARLSEAASGLLSAVEAAGFPLGRDAGVARADGTVTVGFGEGGHGIAVLQGIAALDLPRSKPWIIGRPPETVYIARERGGTKLARVYDKGLESVSAPRGTRIRFENQVRYSKQLRRAVEEVDLGHVRRRFEARFGPVAKSASGVTVASLPVMAAKLHDRVAAGELTRPQVDRAVGYLLLGAVGLPRRTQFERRRELRSLGLVLADDLIAPVEVDLGATLDAVLAGWDDD
jgi:hypothetical protein